MEDIEKSGQEIRTDGEIVEFPRDESAGDP
jgi:hypothetical protein